MKNSMAASMCYHYADVVHTLTVMAILLAFMLRRVPGHELLAERAFGGVGFIWRIKHLLQTPAFWSAQSSSPDGVTAVVPIREIVHHLYQGVDDQFRDSLAAWWCVSPQIGRRALSS